MDRKQFRNVFADEAAEILAVGIAMFYLGYSNAVLIGLTKHETSRPQKVYVLASRAVLGRNARESSTRFLK